MKYVRITILGTSIKGNGTIGLNILDIDTLDIIARVLCINWTVKWCMSLQCHSTIQGPALHVTDVLHCLWRDNLLEKIKDVY